MRNNTRLWAISWFWQILKQNMFIFVVPFPEPKRWRLPATVTASYSQRSSVSPFRSTSSPLPPATHPVWWVTDGRRGGGAGDETSHLAVVARPAGHVFLRLDVARRAEGLHPGLRHHCAHDFCLHGDKRVPVVRDLLIGSQLQFAGKRVGVIHGCKNRRHNKGLKLRRRNPRLRANG